MLHFCIFEHLPLPHALACFRNWARFPFRESGLGFQGQPTTQQQRTVQPRDKKRKKKKDRHAGYGRFQANPVLQQHSKSNNLSSLGQEKHPIRFGRTARVPVFGNGWFSQSHRLSPTSPQCKRKRSRLQVTKIVTRKFRRFVIIAQRLTAAAAGECSAMSIMNAVQYELEDEWSNGWRDGYCSFGWCPRQVVMMDRGAGANCCPTPHSNPCLR